MKKIDLTGNRYGMLTVVSEVLERRNNLIYWSCLCDCGKTSIVLGTNLKHGRQKSCGCSQGNPKHLQSNTKLYKVWAGMKNRCKKGRYLDRGTIVCSEWVGSFTLFYFWATSNGYKEGLQIDRIDNSGNYEPSNCRFITNRGNYFNKNTFKTCRNKTGFVGVYFSSSYNRFRSGIRVHGKEVYIGSADTAKEACILRDQYIIDNDLREYELQVLKWKN